jgi:hypothetical protein
MTMFVQGHIWVHLNMILASRVQRRWLDSQMVLQGVRFEDIVLAWFKGAR